MIATMYDTMDAAHGVGLAANQIGYGLRLFVYDCADDRGTAAGAVSSSIRSGNLRNPRDHARPGRRRRGLLVVPGESFPTGRAKWARVTGLDADGDPIAIEGTGLFARMLQHETGHLTGFVLQHPGKQAGALDGDRTAVGIQSGHPCPLGPAGGERLAGNRQAAFVVDPWGRAWSRGISEVSRTGLMIDTGRRWVSPRSSAQSYTNSHSPYPDCWRPGPPRARRPWSVQGGDQFGQHPPVANRRRRPAPVSSGYARPDLPRSELVPLP